MRVLFLLRQSQGPLARYVRALQAGLERKGITIELETCDFIPDRTGWRTDRKVSKELRRRAKDFDLVHAFGYRAAWACAEAFYVRRRWLYTAFDKTKTTRHELIDRLAAAQVGCCVAPGIRDEFEGKDLTNLRLLQAGASYENLPSRAQARSRLKLDESAEVALVYLHDGVHPGEFADDLRYRNPPSQRLYVLAGEPLDAELQARVEDLPHVRCVSPEVSDDWAAACDVVAAWPERLGFSDVVAKAMAGEAPLITFRPFVLADMVTERRSGELIDEEGELLSALDRALNDMTRTRDWGRNASLRARHVFNIDRSVEKTLDIYRELGQ